MFFDNEAALIEQNESDKHDLECEMALYGYTENETDFFDTKSYERLVIDFIKNKRKYINNFNLPSKTIKFIRDNANKIIVDQTGSLNRKVLYLEDDQRLIYDFTAEYGEITPLPLFNSTFIIKISSSFFMPFPTKYYKLP